MTTRAGLFLGLGSVALGACSDSDAIKKVRVDPITVLRIGEGQSAQFGVALTSPPDSPVMIALHAEAPGRVMLDPDPLVFAPGQSDKQMVTVHALDNPDVEGDQSFYVRAAAAASDDLGYQGAAVDDVFVTVTDDDAPGIAIDPKDPVVNEGGTAQFTVRLASRPRSPVSFTIAPRDPRLTQAPVTYVFQPLTWDQPLPLPVIAADDNSVLVGPTMLDVSAFVSTDPGQGGFVPPSIAVAVADNDMAGVDLRDPFGNMNFAIARENDHATLEVRLLSRPAAPVTLDLVPHDPRMSPVSVAIQPSDWNVQHELLLPVMDDSVHEGDVSVTLDVISHSADPLYSEKTVPNASVFVIDND
jgi:hypothetical protein